MSDGKREGTVFIENNMAGGKGFKVRYHPIYKQRGNGKPHLSDSQGGPVNGKEGTIKPLTGK